MTDALRAGPATPGLPAFDRIRIEDLRAAGSLKWSAYPGTIGAWVAEMDFGVSPQIEHALQDAVAHARLGYPSPALTTAMAEAYAAWSAERYGWHVPAGRVRPLPDVLAGLEAVIRHFTAPGSPVILPTPAYMPFLTLPLTLGREVLQVPLLPDGGYDLDALDAAFAAGGSLLVLCNPHNPTGRVLTRGEMLAIAEVVERHGGRVFSDEIHAPLVYPGHEHLPYASVSDATAAHTITAASASKAWNVPGLKCAQLVLSNAEDAATWRRVGFFVEHLTATPGLVASAAAYLDSADWLAGVLAYLGRNRRTLAELVAEHLPGVVHRSPEGTYLAWLDCRAVGLEEPARFFRDKAGVALVEGTECGEAGRGFVRLNLAMPRPILAQALEQMGTALSNR